MKRLETSHFPILALCLFLSHCFTACSSSQNQQSPMDADPQIIESLTIEGWSEITMFANFAKIGIDSFAHFKTSRNACGKDAYGSIQTQQEWNQLIDLTNSVLKSEMNSSEHCFTFTQELDSQGVPKKFMDGMTEVKLLTGKTLEVLTFRGNEICTPLTRVELARAYFEALNRVVLLADQEDCPFGWGSAL